MKHVVFRSGFVLLGYVFFKIRFTDTNYGTVHLTIMNIGIV